MDIYEKAKMEKARGLRYKRAALASLTFDDILTELYDIEEQCGELEWLFDDNDNYLEAFDDNDDEAAEFKMSINDLAYNCEQLLGQIQNNIADGAEFNDCVVGLIGNRYNLLGFDTYEEDYFSLTGWDADLALSETGKRLCRKTKAELIADIGQCLGIVLAYMDIRQKYDYLSATMDILRGENMSLLQNIKDIEQAYEDAAKDDWQGKAVREFDKLTARLPEEMRVK